MSPDGSELWVGALFELIWMSQFVQFKKKKRNLNACSDMTMLSLYMATWHMFKIFCDLNTSWQLLWNLKTFFILCITKVWKNKWRGSRKQPHLTRLPQTKDPNIWLKPPSPFFFFILWNNAFTTDILQIYYVLNKVIDLLQSCAEETRGLQLYHSC